MGIMKGIKGNVSSYQMQKASKEKYRLTTSAGKLIISFNEVDFNDRLDLEYGRVVLSYCSKWNKFNNQGIKELMLKRIAQSLKMSYFDVTHNYVKSWYIDRENNLFYYWYR